jgi:hypothetical protein
VFVGVIDFVGVFVGVWVLVVVFVGVCVLVGDTVGVCVGDTDIVGVTPVVYVVPLPPQPGQSDMFESVGVTVCVKV